MTEEIRGRVPPASVEQRLAAIEAEQRAQGAKLDKVLRALSRDRLDPESEDGLVEVQEEHSREIKKLDGRLTLIENQAAKHGDRWVAFLLDLAKTIGGGVVGAWLTVKGAPHP